MTGHVNVSTVWKVAHSVYAKVAGVWKGPVVGYVKVGSSWKQWTFEPVTHTYTAASPGGYVETCPTGASSLTITLAGAGSGGSVGDPGPGNGGSSGAVGVKTIAITEAMWGTTFGHQPGTGGDGADGVGTGSGGEESWVDHSVFSGNYPRAGGGAASNPGDTLNCDSGTSGNLHSGATGGSGVSSNGLTSGAGGTGGSGEFGSGSAGGDGSVKYEWT